MLRKTLTVWMILLFIISACNNNQSSQKGGDYEEIKKMVIDILQTEDGKKAFQKLATDEEVKKHLVIESDVVQETLQEVLTNEEGEKMWVKLFQDPTFAKIYAQLIAEEQKEIMKQLMNDAEFQKQMIDLLQNQEIHQQMLTILKSQQFRSHLEKLIQQTFETPLFQAKIADLLLKVAEEKAENKPEEEKKEKKDQPEEDKENQSSENNEKEDAEQAS